MLSELPEVIFKGTEFEEQLSNLTSDSQANKRVYEDYDFKDETSAKPIPTEKKLKVFKKDDNVETLLSALEAQNEKSKQQVEYSFIPPKQDDGDILTSPGDFENASTSPVSDVTYVNTKLVDFISSVLLEENQGLALHQLTLKLINIGESFHSLLPINLPYEPYVIANYVERQLRRYISDTSSSKQSLLSLKNSSNGTVYVSTTLPCPVELKPNITAIDTAERNSYLWGILQPPEPSAEGPFTWNGASSHEGDINNNDTELGLIENPMNLETPKIDYATPHIKESNTPLFTYNFNISGFDGDSCIEKFTPLDALDIKPSPIDVDAHFQPEMLPPLFETFS